MPTLTELHMWMRRQVDFMEAKMADLDIRPLVRPLVRAYLERSRTLMLNNLLESQIRNFDRN